MELLKKCDFRNKKIVYLSPHYDDMAFSNGGLVRKMIHTCAQLILINVFTISCWAPNISKNKMSEISYLRDIENKHYCMIHNLKSVDLLFEDSSVRGYNDISELVGETNKDPLFLEVKSHLIHVIESLDCDFLFCPLAIGNHIDHKMVFETVNKIKNKNLIFYEDLPYAYKYSQNDMFEIVDSRIGYAKPYYIDITTKIDLKINDAKVYKSQIEADTIKEILCYSMQFKPHRYFERVWIMS